MNDNIIIDWKDGDLEYIKLLIMNGVKINNINRYHGKSPIMVAANNGNIEIAELLLLNGANIHDKDYEWYNSLYLATYRGHIKMIKLLLSYGANIGFKDYNGNEYNSLTLATMFKVYNNNYIEIAKILKKWPLTMLIIVLQELIVYHVIDYSSFIDFIQYYD